MGKIANASKPFSHSFVYNDEPFTLLIRTDFTADQFAELQVKAKRAVKEEDTVQIAEICRFLLVAWDVEGPDGVVDLQDSVQIMKTVPFLLLEAISSQAQRTITSGGLVKKT